MRAIYESRLRKQLLAMDTFDGRGPPAATLSLGCCGTGMPLLPGNMLAGSEAELPSTPEL